MTEAGRTDDAKEGDAVYVAVLQAYVQGAMLPLCSILLPGVFAR